MSRHQADLVLCMRQPGTHFGLVCSKCDGKCPLCDSYTDPTVPVRLCAQCSQGRSAKNCIICGNPNGIVTAHFCAECCRAERNRDGCPRVLNVGNNRLEHHFDSRQTSK
ncbi:hypothetical protein TBLA_0F03290 [Henningerozyma blattae CBS 6284]|uniref:PHF5-like protein n=1 Tax=Henningerozyma blattae (strain ATCC 34711 / CBS 6284 / DSM 70876 / NBRC 10599 / NRRL Y-10934 / UCD 77-7) TaxID=1071380 RepID=I2H665_HENB6|nr:hypothetical protein TBLA_0F03290 [Tetrapisispora blattae CBS 6284]CCH61867.1 hypothetical protein TBLA_0F03290 [Tetrapisispora blattae CBS 6284]